ncbi:MAG: bifunctional oligoribonuclease/PAP phosphatase NrnA [Eubacterium sp.]|nr:bifunctional oligoribonuclease/PAP phosphatase NrnA [Eubacterium sp.]
MIKSLDEQLSGVRHVAVAGHVKPDGDCIGSCLATYNYIREYYPGIQIQLFLEPIPNIFKFLPRAQEIISDMDTLPCPDLLIVQDCGDAGRLGRAAGLIANAKRVICIDHHISNTGFGDDSRIVPTASSTSELVFGLLDKERITRPIAACIYTGIIHDTGLFQYSCTSPETMRIAAFLMEKGIDFSGIADRTYVQKTYEQNQILARAIQKSRLHLDGACISSIITSEDMQACGVLPKHLEGIVSQLRSTKGVEAAVFFYPKDEGVEKKEYKISFRSGSDAVNVAKIAAHFGGGGHIRAAGASTSLQPEECLEQILGMVVKQLEQNRRSTETERQP